MLMGAIGISPMVTSEAESLGVMGRSAFLTGGQSLPNTSNSPLLSAVIVTQQQSLGPSPFTSSSLPPHLSVPSATVASTALGTPLIQTTTASPFVSAEVSMVVPSIFNSQINDT